MQLSPRRPVSGQYYPYIDGLRALAVLAVFIFHLNSAWLPGGFVGVDVFFVISGFVVSASMVNHPGRNLLEFLGLFYSRRLKRLFPALIVCLLVTTVLTALFVPTSFLSVANQKTGLSAFFGFSNFLLANGGRDYFGTLTEFNPYTHTWSLAVEEQFYLVFPLLFFGWVVGGRLRWLSCGLLAAGVLASGIFSTWQSSSDPTAAFFLSPGRFWELAAGALLFQFIDSRERDATGKALWRLVVATLSLGLLGAGFFLSRPQHFPMPGALIAVAATLGLIASLHQANGDNPIQRLLGTRWLVSVGLISYSLYLWHWPVFVMFRWTCGLDSIITQLAATLLSFALAIASYQWVEKPVRHSAWLRRAPTYAVVGCALLAITASWHIAKKINKKTSELSLSVVVQNLQQWTPYEYASLPDHPGCRVATQGTVMGGGIRYDYQPQGCDQPISVGNTHLFTIGDSHNMSYSRMFKQFSVEAASLVTSYDNGGCPFLSFQPERDLDNAACRNNTEAALLDIKQHAKPGDILFLPSLRLPRFADQWAYLGDGWVNEKMFGERAVQDRERATENAITMLRPITELGIKVVFEAPKPVFYSPAMRCADWSNRANPACKFGLEIPRDKVEALRAPVMTRLAEITNAVPGVSVWDPLPVLCPTASCNAFDGSKPLFFDADHLSGHGNEVLLRPFMSFMAAHFPPQAPQLTAVP